MTCEHLSQHTAHHNVMARQVALLDAGCGEGMYVGRVQAMLQGAGKACTAHGVDVSKTAIRMAAKRHRAVSFAVASSYILPFDNQARAKYLCWSAGLSHHNFLCFCSVLPKRQIVKHLMSRPQACG